MKPPVLETGRLRLRPFAAGDAADVQRLAGAREIADTTRLIPHPYADGVAEAWIATHPSLHAQDRALTLAVERKDEARLVGAIGLRLQGEDRNAELGYWIGVPEWGRGFATEAARAVVDFGFGVLGLERIWATHFTRNPASGRVMEKIGMAREGLLRRHMRKWGVFEDVVVFAVLRSEWEDRRRGERARAGRRPGAGKEGTVLGKGDQRSKRGKIHRGTYGKRRRRKKKAARKKNEGAAR